MIDVNGMAHVILTVSQFDKARVFYSALVVTSSVLTICRPLRPG